MQKKLTVKKYGKEDVLLEQEVLDESIITVGNNPSATLELNGAKIAPEQFVIISENQQILLLNRADGTSINGETLDLGGRVELEIGDNIEVGEFEISFTEQANNGTSNSFEENSDTDENDADSTETEDRGKDFSEVLNNLKEEDTFYFRLLNKELINERVVFDSENIWLGTSFAEPAIKKDKNDLDEVFAYIKKDWSGAVIYPEDDEDVLLNGEKLNEPQRLKNEDELILIDDFAEEEDEPTKITFHEPVVLLALNSILPEDLPEPISLQSDEINTDINAEMDSVEEGSETKEKNLQTSHKKKKKKRRIFGYFTFLEIFIMAIGTLVTAIIIFLVLEFV